MDMNQYIDQTKEIYSTILEYIDNEDEPETDVKLDELVSLVDKPRHDFKYEEIVEILQIISEISKYHHRYPDFFNKIEKIIFRLSKKIKDNFTNQQIFNIFKNNKRILLFLFKSQIIIPNKSILHFIYRKSLTNQQNEEEEEEEEEEEKEKEEKDDDEKVEYEFEKKCAEKLDLVKHRKKYNFKKYEEEEIKYEYEYEKKCAKEHELVKHRKKYNFEKNEEEEEEEKYDDEEKEYVYEHTYKKNCAAKKYQYNFNYDIYFYPEIKQFIDVEMQKKIEEKAKKIDEFIFTNFEEKQKNGENESYLCEMIRNDFVEEFIAYVNKSNISLNSTIKPSVFETNSLLIKKEPSLIEYAAFFGSIQIFQYLNSNNVKLNENLWYYVIHSKNTELIQILEENILVEQNQNYKYYIKEAIKCHHNKIANYIIANLIEKRKYLYDVYNFFDDNITSYCFQYHNFSFYPKKIRKEMLFLYFCQYNYIKLVQLSLKEMVSINNEHINAYIPKFFYSIYRNDVKGNMFYNIGLQIAFNNNY